MDGLIDEARRGVDRGLAGGQVREVGVAEVDWGEAGDGQRLGAAVQ
jgi:hypothetical protein